MLHEFTVKMPLSNVDEAMEKLTMNDFYNLYYDQPIEQFPEENGYGFTELQDTHIELKVIVEAGNDLNIEGTKKEVASILDIPLEDVLYQLLDVQDWQQPFPVIDLKNGWFIQPTLSTESISEGNVIHFEPPRAFGSGLHQTTQDCLQIILSEDLSGKRILDIGTGAGLLSIAAALSGAEQIVATDIEDVETEVLYNARLNDVEDKITVIQGDALSPSFSLEGVFDWIFINIAANEIRDLKGFVNQYLLHNGKLILSGMVEWNYKETLDLYEKQGYSVLDVSQLDEWITALVRKG
ncbi:50S ribosomal protein L11 methyltransferase [Niallia sp. Krafla_26]|uniref:50S ribosomal protein L11 methyltransferase n=1 Tax=Niallia sp. Krafla_26 TaxID=3064703 RepID=UPI003D16D68A